MYNHKTLKDLTMKDNFMFGAVMSIEENCIGFLEMVLGFKIERVVISREKSLVYHPEYRGCAIGYLCKGRTPYPLQCRDAGEEAGESWETKPLLP